MKKHLRCFVWFFAFLLFLQTAPAASAQSDPAGTEADPLINLLLIGQDSDADRISRSDCMILCSFAPKSGRIIFTSFLRDLYVPIPGHRPNRLNAAYAFGGSALLKQTLEEAFCISIDGCIEVDFSSFPRIIDALGGVRVELRQDEADVINAEVPGTLSEGEHLLSGEQALAYSRIRKLDQDGDFSRSLRQRKLLSSLLDSYRSTDLLSVLSAAADTLPLVDSSLSKGDILRLCIRLFPLLQDPEITSQRLPADDTYTCETIRGMDVLTADMDQLREQLQHSLRKIKQDSLQ